MNRYQELAQAAEAFEAIDPSEIDWSNTTIEYPAAPLSAQQWPAFIVERDLNGEIESVTPGPAMEIPVEDLRLESPAVRRQKKA